MSFRAQRECRMPHRISLAEYLRFSLARKHTAASSDVARDLAALRSLPIPIFFLFAGQTVLLVLRSLLQDKRLQDKRLPMSTPNRKTMRVAFQGEPGAFSEAAAIQLLGSAITTIPRHTFETAFTAIAEGAADGRNRASEKLDSGGFAKSARF